MQLPMSIENAAMHSAQTGRAKARPDNAAESFWLLLENGQVVVELPWANL